MFDIAVCLFRPGDVVSLTMGKLAMKHAGTDVDAMKAIASASSKRSLADFQEVFNFIPFFFLQPIRLT